MNTRLSIQLPHALDSFVRTKIMAGRHTSASEVVRDALRLMEDRDMVLANYQSQVWQNIAEALDVLSAAPVTERETILDGVEAQLDQMETVMRAATGGVDLSPRMAATARDTPAPSRAAHHDAAHHDAGDEADLGPDFPLSRQNTIRIEGYAA